MVGELGERTKRKRRNRPTRFEELRKSIRGSEETTSGEGLERELQATESEKERERGRGCG